MTNVSEIRVDFKKKIDIDLLKRVERSIFFLEQLIKKAYAEKLKATHGQAGGIGGIVSEVVHRVNLIQGQIGFTQAADYMKFIEWGVRPGLNAQFPAYGKAPPLRNIYQWLILSRSVIPQSLKDRAEANKARASSDHEHPQFDKKKDKPWYSSDARIIQAFFVAQTIKKHGRPALRIMEKTLQQHIGQLTKYINGEI